MGQRIKLKFRAFDHRSLDAAVKDVVATVKRTGSQVKGPIPLPTHIERFTLNRSTHVDKEAREQFEIRNHTRCVFLEETNPNTVNALMNLDLPSGVEVEVKLIESEN